MGRQSRKRKERRERRQSMTSVPTEEVDTGEVAVTEILSLEVPEVDHCDSFIDDPAAPAALRTFLAFARAPAHGAFLPKPHPRLFADYEGRRVRVTMASRIGDVGIATDFDREYGYEWRVIVRQLSNFSENP